MADGLTRTLGQAGYNVDRTGNADEADAALLAHAYDLIVLDLSLPDGDGLDILRDHRSRRASTPVMIITARSAVDDRIRGLNLGADDYLTKPFDLGEFDARVRALLRRSQSDGLDTLRFGELKMEIDAHRVLVGDEPLTLPRREHQILEVLMTRHGRILSKDEIIERISDFDEDVSAKAVEIYVSRLRKRIEPAGVTIRTVRGVGYLLE